MLMGTLINLMQLFATYSYHLRDSATGSQLTTFYGLMFKTVAVIVSSSLHWTPYPRHRCRTFDTVVAFDNFTATLPTHLQI